MKPLVFTEIKKQDTCIPITDLQQKVTQHCNAIILQFKKERNTLMNITDVFTNKDESFTRCALARILYGALFKRILWKKAAETTDILSPNF